MMSIKRPTGGILEPGLQHEEIPLPYDTPKWAVKHPSHYQSKTGIECIEAIQAICECKDGIEAYCVGNIVKYLWRYSKKNGVEDVEKAEVYMGFLLNYLKTGKVKSDAEK